MADKTDRRCFLARGIVGAAGVGAVYSSIEEDTLLAAMEDGTAKPSQDGAQEPKTDIPPGSMPCGKIGNVSVSRLMIGCNLIGGWAHARDLAYASKLFTSYNTEAKIFETLELAQACGVNTIHVADSTVGTTIKYNQHRTTKIQTLACVPPLADKAKMNEKIKRQLDLGATLIYSHGGWTDSFMMKGGTADVIGQMVDLIKAQGVPAGVGSHSLDIPKACEKAGVNNDFYVKTYHGDKYWSATPKEHRKEYDWMTGGSSDHNLSHNNMWCNNPEETVAFMETVDKPWIAFKTMAAGSILPQKAFPAAYRHGADFILAGMFDFQVEADAKIAIASIRKARNRKRPWLG